MTVRLVSGGKYNFAVVNVANADMVGHTGNTGATIKAIESIDKYLHDMINSVLSVNGSVFITADHGNAEELLMFKPDSYFVTSQEGTLNTEHSSNPVPFIFVTGGEDLSQYQLKDGKIADVAPTILNFMNLTVPDGMTGDNLLYKKTLTGVNQNQNVATNR